MANRKIEISNIEVVDKHIKTVRQSMKETTMRLKDLLNQNPERAFYEMKFGKIGRDPLETSSLNLIEQLNQVYTYLVTLQGVKEMISKYPEHIPFRVNLGTMGGYDIESVDGKIVCECFSTTSLRSNDKVNKDAKRLVNNTEAERRFIFYHISGNEDASYYEEKYEEIKFVKVEIED